MIIVSLDSDYIPKSHDRLTVVSPYKAGRDPGCDAICCMKTVYTNLTVIAPIYLF